MKMTPEMKVRAKEMRDDGLAYVKIGKALEIGEKVVRYYLSPACREQHRAYGFIARAANDRTEYQAGYYIDNKGGSIAEYRGEHREEKNAKQREWNATHKEELARNNAAYAKAHPDRIIAAVALRRAFKAGWLLGATAAQKAEINEIYRKAKEEPNIRCYLCNKLIPLGSRQVDHVQALTNGGAHRASNLAVTCRTCNLKKGGKTLEEMGLLL